MTKFLAIVKREYIQRVRARMFIVMTLLGPLMLVLMTIVPGLMFSLKTGGDTRLAIVDQTAGEQVFATVRDSLVRSQIDEPDEFDKNIGTQLENQVNSNASQRLQEAGKSLSGGFAVERVAPSGSSIEAIKQNLNARIGKDEIDGYLLIPPDILTNNNSNPAYYGRNGGDVITTGQIQKRIDRAIRRQRLIASGVKESEIETLSKQVRIDTYPINDKGEEGAQDSGFSRFMVVFIIAFMIYITVLLYGNVILGAVVEEKETRIAEILFSSVRSFQLMLGKLIGVSLVALTQLTIWGFVFIGVSVWGVAALASQGVEGISIPNLPPIFFLYFVLFFLLGYFIYSTLYLLIGSMVRS
jgi:ABC-2 type transport system permease protein